MKLQHWILDEQHKVIRADLLTWAAFLQLPGKRQVGSDRVAGLLVSTVFIGIDHGCYLEGPPVLWESMVFGETSSDVDCERCAGSWEQAEEMHKRMVNGFRRPLELSLLKKMQTAAKQAEMRERDRCMRICIDVIEHLRAQLNLKLMASAEKHLAEVKYRIATAVIGAVQIKIMSGADPDAEEAESEIHRPDPDAVGEPRLPEPPDPDGGRAG